MGYTLNREELLNCSNNLFEKMKNGEIKANIYKKFKLKKLKRLMKYYNLEKVWFNNFRTINGDP